MRRRRKKSIPVIILLCAVLALWVFERMARQYAATATPMRLAALPKPTSALPDTALPNSPAHNDNFAGLAPGFSSAAGEKQDLITVLNANDRIFVKGRGVARKPPPVAADPDPLFYPTAKLFVSSGSDVSPLNVRDPSALVMPPAN
jgi:hypothetical protein